MTAPFAVGPLLFHPRCDLGGGALTRQHHCPNPHRLKERQREPPLYEMLRLVVQIRLAAPTDDKDARDAVDILVQQREERIDDVAESAVLEIDKRRLARCEMIARRECRCAALVHGDNMRGTVRAVRVHQIVDQRAQLRVGDTCKELCAERREKIAYVH